MRYLLPAALAVALLALAGCAKPDAPPTIYGWAKPVASYDGYLKDRFDCILAARTQVSGGFVNAYGGVSASRQQISSSVFDPCMSARGWHRDDANGFKPPPGGVVMMVD
jgi:hypothetical protein